MDFAKMQLIHRASEELAAAAHGGKAVIAERYAKLLGLSEKRLYSLVKEHRLAVHAAPVRKRRADANSTAISEAELRLIAGVCSESRRAGKEMLSIDQAIDMLVAGGQLKVRLSAGRVSALMRERHMHPDQLAAPSPARRMRTEHPNQLWQCDASVCVLYRTPRGEVELMEREAFYKNKLHNVARVMNDLVVRYVGTDHASGAIGVRYYIGGETAENAVAFLTWLIAQRPGEQGKGLPFYGVPQMLYTDQGSAFKSGLFVNLCKVLDIRLEHHKPRNSRATGQVENAQNLVERGLESRLRFIDAATITMDSLNALGDQWMHAFNGTRTHSRHGMTRYGAWSLITSEQLRTVESLELLRTLATTQPKPCRVSNNMTISFVVKGYERADYDVRNVIGAAPGHRVLVTVNPFQAPSVNVGVTDRETGEIVWQAVAPDQTTKFGFSEADPVFGQGHRSMPATLVDEQRNAITRQAYAADGVLPTLDEADRARRNRRAAYLDQIDPLADLKAAKVPAYMPRRGTPVEAARRDVAPVVLTVVEACKRLRTDLGDAYSPQIYTWVSQRFPDGVPEPQLEGLRAQFARPADDNNTEGGLRAVGGSSQ